MPYATVRSPVPGAQAFHSSDGAAILSQAAQLLMLGAQLRGETSVPPIQATLIAGPAQTESVPPEDVAALGLPSLPAAYGKIDVQRMRNNLALRYKVPAPTSLSGEGEPALSSQVLSDIADRFYKQPDPLGAAELMEACLRHPDEIVRVAAASAYFDRSPEPQRLLRILRGGTKNLDPLIRTLAATSLARIAPEDASLDDLLKPGETGFATGAASHTTVLIHGTWALNSPWWKPGGDFHAYLTNVLPPLPRMPPAPPWSAPYAAGDYYSWSGGYSDTARALAATDLVQWVNNHTAQGLDLVTHSHGGNVAMLATQPGMAISSREMVLLSCPVHFPKYEPDFLKVQKIVSIRVHLDLVVLADRGGQRFNDPHIQENVLPIWFDHFATHDPKVWSQYTVPAML